MHILVFRHYQEASRVQLSRREGISCTLRLGVNSRYISQTFIRGAKDGKLKFSTKRDVIVKPHSASPWMLEFQSHFDRISKIC